MTTKPEKPKTRKAPAPLEEDRPHRAVVLTVQQLDELNDIHRLLQLIGFLLGTGFDEYRRPAISALARLVDGRLAALIEEFNASAAAEVSP